MAARRKSRSRSRGASRGSRGTPAWIWLLTGILIGLGLAWFLFKKGYVPALPGESAKPAEVAAPGPSTGGEEVAPQSAETKRSKYDFFTVLPEMEVVVPDQEAADQTQAETATASGAPGGASYLLQVGSFREAGDADQLKAQLALLGVVARVQSVTVNNATWHRVRIGPLRSAREADEMRNHLADNGIDSLVLKDQ